MSTKPKDEQTPNADIIDTSGMSKGKRDALELTEASREGHWTYPTFAGALFMGQFPWDLVYPYPQLPEDRTEAGEEFLRKLEAFFREKVDPDEIDRTGEIPDDVVQGLADLGAFGVKIPRDLGGLGLTQFYYSRAAMIAGSYCSNCAALLSAHQSIGIPSPLLKFGTDDQKRRFLPRCARGEISAFALTEAGVGSDPARMATTAEPTADGEHFILNGNKLWCTNGTVAKLLVVMAKTPPKMIRGRSVNQTTAFIVEANAPGVEVTHRSRFMGLKALYNAEIKFTNVKVPREDIIAGEGKGLRVALTTLNTGRLTLPANCVGAIRACLNYVKPWANERVQWGAPIGKHAAIADKIGSMAATTFAIDAMTSLTSLLVDRGKTDIRIEAAMCKMFGTEKAWDIIYDTMQVIGGRAYETAQSNTARGDYPYPVERIMRDMRVNTLFEGSSEIMRLFLAREAMDPHLRAAGEAVNTKLPTDRRLKAAMKAAGFYARWYPKQWLSMGGPATDGMYSALRKEVHYVAKTSHKLARRMFHAMITQGAKLERQQLLLGRFVEVGTELFAIAACCTRAQYLIGQGYEKKEVLALVDHFCRESKLRIDGFFRGVKRNNDASGYRLAQKVLDGQASWLTEEVVGERDRTAARSEEAVTT